MYAPLLELFVSPAGGSLRSHLSAGKFVLAAIAVPLQPGSSLSTPNGTNTVQTF